MTMQMIDMTGEYRPELDGTVTVRFTLCGLAPEQADDVGEKLALAIKGILAGYSTDGEVTMRKKGDMLS